VIVYTGRYEIVEIPANLARITCLIQVLYTI
jgi:hypothetical protein